MTGPNRSIVLGIRWPNPETDESVCPTLETFRKAANSSQRHKNNVTTLNLVQMHAQGVSEGLCLKNDKQVYIAQRGYLRMPRQNSISKNTISLTISCFCRARIYPGRSEFCSHFVELLEAVFFIAVLPSFALCTFPFASWVCFVPMT